MEEIITTEYRNWIKDIASRFKKTQIKAALKVNDEVLRFYFSLGEEINRNQEKNTYGSNFYEKISKDLKHEMPEVECFSPSNLRYMVRFYVLYKDMFPNFPQLGEDLFLVPWGHHKQIID